MQVDNLNPNKQKYPKYLKFIQEESMQGIFNSFKDETETNFTMYQNRDDFENGYEKDYYDNCIQNTLHHENNKIKKVYLKDLLKINTDFLQFEPLDLKKTITPKKNVFSRKLKGKSSVSKFNFKCGKDLKIMTISGDVHFNLRLIDEYIKNRIKYEDTSNNIDLGDKKIKKIHFRNDTTEKNIIGQVEIEDLVMRANLITEPKYQEISNTMRILLNFFTLVKKIHTKKFKRRIDGDKSMTSKADKTNQVKFEKVKNEIFTYKKLDDFFFKNKENTNVIITTMENKIQKFEKKKKEELHENLKEKMRNLIFNDEDSVDNYMNNDISEGSDEGIDLEGSGEKPFLMTIKKGLPDTSNKYKRRGNVKIEAESKERNFEILPQHKSRFLTGFRKYLKTQLKKK